MLAASVAAQAGASVAINGPAFLIPSLQETRGLSLAEAGTLAAMPIAGVMLTLFVWGLVVDRVGERTRAARRPGRYRRSSVRRPRTVDRTRWRLGRGALRGRHGRRQHRLGQRAHRGRLVPPQRRGLAMGIRQMAQPLGVAVAAATIAVTADRVGLDGRAVDPGGRGGARLRGGAGDRARPTTPGRDGGADRQPLPGRAAFLARVHGVSVLLVVPQFLVWTYSLTWLVQERRLVGGRRPAPWSPPPTCSGRSAGSASGQLSDVVGSRVRPLRWVAVAAAVTMALLGADRAVRGRRRCCSWWPPRSPWPTTGWPSPAWRSGPARTGPAGRSACRTRRSTSPPPPPHRSPGSRSRHWGYAATFGVAALVPARRLHAGSPGGRVERRRA